MKKISIIFKGERKRERERERRRERERERERDEREEERERERRERRERERERFTFIHALLQHYDNHCAVSWQGRLQKSRLRGLEGCCGIHWRSNH